MQTIKIKIWMYVRLKYGIIGSCPECRLAAGFYGGH
jgi:hypothetical protein